MQEHPAVRSVAVIGLPDDDLGNVVHAIVEADPEAVPPEDLLAFVGRPVGPLQGPTLGRIHRPAPAQRGRQGPPECLCGCRTRLTAARTPDD